MVTDEEEAKLDPELAVLSAMAHGRDGDSQRSVQIATAALAASLGLDAERSTLYLDLVLSSLGRAAREALQAMDPAKYEYQSKFAKRFLSQGKAEGKAEGRAEVLLKLLTLRFGPLSEAVQARVRAAAVSQLDTFAERVRSVQSLDDIFRA